MVKLLIVVNSQKGTVENDKRKRFGARQVHDGVTPQRCHFICVKYQIMTMIHVTQ